jgi:hypothetical protein
MSAFFLPEVHRRHDILWSGVGMFYALALWIYGDRISGGLLVAQTAGVLLILWQGWQVLKLRRQITPEAQRTELPNGAKNLDEVVSQQTEAIASKVRPKTATTVATAAPSATTATEAKPQAAPATEPEPACTLEENRAAFDERNGHVESASPDLATASSEMPSPATGEPTRATPPSNPESSATDEVSTPLETEDTESTVNEATTTLEELKPAIATNGAKSDPTTQGAPEHHSVENNDATSQPMQAEPTDAAQANERSPQSQQSSTEPSRPTQPDAIAPEIIPDSEAPKPPRRDRSAPKARPAAQTNDTKPSAGEKSQGDRPERPRPNIVVLPRRKRGLAGAMERVKGIFGGQSADPQPMKPVNPPPTSKPQPTPPPPKAKSTPDNDLTELAEGWDDWDDDASPQPERPPERSPQVLRAELISPYEDTPPPSPYEEESSV